MIVSRHLACSLAGALALTGFQPISAGAASPETVEQGAALFSENCEACHQPDAIGEPGIAPALTTPEFLAIVSDRFLLGTITDGRDGTGMAPFDHLGEDNIRAIIAFLRSHTDEPSRAAEVDAQPSASGDPRLGAIWFNDICSTCHGVDGDGYDAGGTGTAIGLPGFLSKATDGFIRETVRHGRSNTRMRGFQGPAALASLTDEEIDDIIVYLRSLAAN